MAPTRIGRELATIKSGQTIGPWLSSERWRRGQVIVPAASGIASFTFNVSNDLDGADATAYPLRDQAGVALSLDLGAGPMIPLLPALFSYRFIQPIANAAPGGGRTFEFVVVDGPATWRRVPAPILAGAQRSIAAELGGASAGSFSIPVGLTGGAVTFLVGDGAGPATVWSSVVDAAGAAISQDVAAAGLFTLPRECFGAPAMQVFAGGVQSGRRAVDLWLKEEG
jgi:hypothetical protein